MRIIILLLFLGINYLGKADTLTFWHVYYNANLVAELNELSNEYKLIIEKSKIKKGDSITVYYFRDTPCSSCKSTLQVQDNNNQEVAVWNGVGTTTIKKFAIEDLLKSGSEFFVVWYIEEISGTKLLKSRLFKIKID